MDLIAGAEQKYPTFDVFWWTFGFVASGFSWLTILTTLGWTTIPLMYMIPIVIGSLVCNFLTDMNKAAIEARVRFRMEEKEKQVREEKALEFAAKDAVAVALEMNWTTHYKGHWLDRDIDMYIRTLNSHIAWGRFTYF